MDSQWLGCGDNTAVDKLVGDIYGQGDGALPE